MIPFLLSSYWRLGLAVGLVAVVALMGWRVSAWHEAYKALPAAQDALRNEIDCNPDSHCAERVLAFQAAQDAHNREVADAYARQIDEINNRPAPAVPVRLCRPARPGGVPSTDAARPVDGSTAPGDLQVEVGKDIAVELYRLADDADREVAKLRALQEWNRALAAQE